MRFKPYLLATSALLAAGFGASAHAQARAGSNAASANTIQELVVTAEKRSQNLQDVPVAISAFSDKTRDVVGIQSIQDMTNFTPGLQYSTSTDRITLRGLGRLTNVLSADASVANYLDGIYETFAVNAGASTLFLDRVEVLRGPQGTLYGRNAIAGAINEISRRPTKDWYAEVRAGYANYDHSDLEFAVSGPLADNVQFRVAGQWEDQRDGYIKSTVPGRPSEGNVVNTFHLEGQIAVQFSPKLEMWSKFAYDNWQNGAGGPGAQSGGWSPNIYNADPTHPNQVLPDISPGNPNGGNGFNIIEFPQFATAINEGFGCSGLPTNVVLLSSSGCVNTAHNSPWEKPDPVSYRVRLPNAYTVASEWTYHAPGFDVKYITGGVHYYYLLTGSVPNGSRQAPVDSFQAGATQFFPLESFNYQEHNGFWSHELNLVSTTEGPLQWIAGYYLFRQHYTQPVYTLEDTRRRRGRAGHLLPAGHRPTVRQPARRPRRLLGHLRPGQLQGPADAHADRRAALFARPQVRHRVGPADLLRPAVLPRRHAAGGLLGAPRPDGGDQRGGRRHRQSARHDPAGRHRPDQLRPGDRLRHPPL
jgi:iron complex outermembrane receptor protein